MAKKTKGSKKHQLTPTQKQMLNRRLELVEEIYAEMESAIVRTEIDMRYTQSMLNTKQIQGKKNLRRMVLRYEQEQEQLMVRKVLLTIIMSEKRDILDKLDGKLSFEYDARAGFEPPKINHGAPEVTDGEILIDPSNPPAAPTQGGEEAMDDTQTETQEEQVEELEESTDDEAADEAAEAEETEDEAAAE